MPKENRIEPFFDVKEANEDIEVFKKWFKKNKPNAIICLYNSVEKWVDDMGLKVPQDLGLIQLERRTHQGKWAGMNQRNDIAGEAAIERLSQILYSPNPDFNINITASLISPEWVESETILNRNKISKKKSL